MQTIHVSLLIFTLLAVGSSQPVEPNSRQEEQNSPKLEDQCSFDDLMCHESLNESQDSPLDETVNEEEPQSAPKQEPQVEDKESSSHKCEENKARHDVLLHTLEAEDALKRVRSVLRDAILDYNELFDERRKVCTKLQNVIEAYRGYTTSIENTDKLIRETIRSFTRTLCCKTDNLAIQDHIDMSDSLVEVLRDSKSKLELYDAVEKFRESFKEYNAIANSKSRSHVYRTCKDLRRTLDVALKARERYTNIMKSFTDTSLLDEKIHLSLDATFRNTIKNIVLVCKMIDRCFGDLNQDKLEDGSAA
ncbi:signal peptide containing protein [Theileria equi strain WA]|uniref:Signal peptide containing protein n=1 Tax=Theileria equi strain WA TaxID=1537102 RepID=L1LEM9_THEEQ|nr:signal peptide containing protein [Theileria equi strain WA]EKX73633.1 signal peptide containing protein [Theileria equi strain WA]|eukprot:XP_004833085.1 signal peptide containing protein [Theileria equi strain WA]